MKKDRNQEVAITLMEAVNCFGLDRKKVAEYMANEHRTLQQSFTGICVEWLKTLAEMEYYDDRNEASVKFAKRLIKKSPMVEELFNESTFPMI